MTFGIDKSGTEKSEIDSEAQTSKPGKHKPILAASIVLTAVVFLFVMGVSSMSMSPAGIDSGMFTNSNEFGNDMHYIEITPAPATFSIWGFIYTWQVVWLIYVVVGLFRKNQEGAPLYASPEIQTPLLYGSYMINLMCNVGWLVLWDRLLIGWALILIALLPFTLYICLVISHRRLMANGNYMMKMGMQKDIWMIRLFVQNGLAFYATWVTIATLLNFTIVLAYQLGVDQSIASTVSLSILAAEVVTWFVLDVFVFDRYTRYQFSPYIVVIVALAGSLAKNYTPLATNSLFTLVLMGVAVLTAIVKVVMLFYRHFKSPVFQNKVGVNIESTDM